MNMTNVLNEIKEIIRGNVNNKLNEILVMVADELGVAAREGRLPEYLQRGSKVKYRMSEYGAYKGVVFFLTLGSPSIEVDTAECQIKLRWGRDEERAIRLSDDVKHALDNYFRDVYAREIGTYGHYLTR